MLHFPPCTEEHVYISRHDKLLHPASTRHSYIIYNRLFWAMLFAMKMTLEDFLQKYASDHQHPTNQKIHTICVPIIFWSIFAFADSISLTQRLSLGHLFGLIALAYYIQVNCSQVNRASFGAPPKTWRRPSFLLGCSCFCREFSLSATSLCFLRS